MIELMIVVAIIAFLATISIPNFFKYLAKAKQAEVALNLASLHAAEQAYWYEYGTYSTELAGEKGIGWQPAGYKRDGEKNFHYTYGFNISGSSEGKNFFTGKLETSSSKFPETFASKEGFRAAAIGSVPGSSKVDIWTIDENRTIKHVQNGLG